MTPYPPHNKRLQRTGISVPFIDNLSQDTVVARPLKRRVGLLTSWLKTMSWNYRVMKKAGHLAVYPVYYDDRGNIRGWSERPFSPEAESLEELRTTLELMLDAFEKEIIEDEASPEPS